MTIRHLKLFIEVAETGRMSKAAAKFYISQPTVSQAVAELESHYGVRLFERLSQRLYITDAGKQLLSQARQVVAAFDSLETSMQQLSATPVLRVGATVTVGTCLIGEAVQRFRGEMPGAEVTVFVDNTRTIEQRMLDSELDLALVEGQVKSPELVATPIIDDYLVLVCPAKHPFAAREQVLLSELAAERFILREEGSGTRELFTRYMEERRLPVKAAWVCSNSDAIKDAVLRGEGLTMISVRLVEREIRSGVLKIVPLVQGKDGKPCQFQRKFSLILHKNKFITSAISGMVGVMSGMQRTDLMELVRSGGSFR